MSAINGHRPADPATEIAAAVWTANMDDGDLDWEDLGEDERAHLIDWAKSYIGGHVAWLAQNGFEIQPANAIRRPKSDDEAMAMVKAAKDYFDGKRRKGELVNTAVPKKLIIPGAN